MKKIKTQFLMLTMIGFAVFVSPAAAEEPEARAVSMIKQFLDICTSTADLNAAGDAIVAAKLAHVSRLNKNDPTHLNPDALRFSFKKAHAAAKLYDAEISRVVITGTSALGLGPTAQKGKLYKYFVKKKTGVNGMPAPVQVFFPDEATADGKVGTEPVLYDWGSF